jgi:hypothetical protein
VVVDALGDAQRGVRRGHRVERDTTRVGLTDPGRVGKPVVRISLVVVNDRAKNRDVPRATRNQGFDRALDAGEQTVVSPRASVIAR